MSNSDFVVPADDAEDREFIRFANAYNAYQVFSDDPEGRREIVRQVRVEWDRTGRLPDDLVPLRTCLFQRARAHHHLADGTLFKDEPLVRALIDKIREISNRAV